MLHSLWVPGPEWTNLEAPAMHFSLEGRRRFRPEKQYYVQNVYQQTLLLTLKDK